MNKNKSYYNQLIFYERVERFLGEIVYFIFMFHRVRVSMGFVQIFEIKKTFLCVLSRLSVGSLIRFLISVPFLTNIF